MRQTLKLSLTLVLACLMLFAVAVVASAEAKPTASGTCGESLIYQYYDDTKTLIISGTGKMDNYSTKTMPWYSQLGSFETIIVEEGVTQIGTTAFFGATSLKEVRLPDSLVTIGGYAFQNCTALEKVYFGSGLKEVYDAAFKGCSSMTEVHIKDLSGWCKVAFSSFTSHPVSRNPGCGFYLNDELLVDVVVPSDVTSLSRYTFYFCYSIKTITFHENITHFGDASLQGLNRATTMIFNNGGFTTGTKVFGDTLTYLTDIYVNDPAKWCTNVYSGNGSIPNRANSNLTIHFGDYDLTPGKTENPITLPIPAGVTTINANIFYDCDNVTVVIIPESMTSINGCKSDNGAFAYGRVYKVYGAAGSYAQTYATENGLTFSGYAIKDVTGVELDAAEATVNVGETYTLTATVTPSNATFNTVAWSSSDLSVATVSAGVVTAVGAGEATITVTTDDGSFTDTCVITVPSVDVTGIQLDATTLEVYEGHKAALTATVLPANASNKEVIWASLNEGVATVVNGVITPVSAGTATITATTAEGAFVAECQVTVVTPTIFVKSVAIDPAEFQLAVGEQLQLNAIITPADATNQEVTWVSWNKSVVTVDANGLVTAVGEGTTQIKVASVEDPSISKKCNVTVVAPADVDVEEIALDCEELEIVIGKEYAFTVEFTPANTTQKNLYWESSNEDVATITEDGVLEAVGFGDTIITVISLDNEDLFAECYVTVVEGKKVESVTLNKTSANVLLGDIVNLVANVNPSDAEDISVTWSSSNEDVATVVDGVVTTVGSGVANITVTTVDGGFTATCKIIVTLGNELPPQEWN